MPTEPSFTVVTRGIGKPDYSSEISRGFIRPGFSLEYNQTLLAFLLTPSSVASAYGWVTAPLAVGAHAHLIDGVTGLALPYTVPVGFTLTMVSIGIVCDQDVEVWQLLQVAPIPTTQRMLCLAHLTGGTPFYVPDVVAFSSAAFDPGATAAFDFDIEVHNKGGAVLEGQIGVYMILEAVATPPLPTTKGVKCKWCGTLNEVPQSQSIVVCDKCEEITIVYPLQSGLRET